MNTIEQLYLKIVINSYQTDTLKEHAQYVEQKGRGDHCEIVEDME